MSAAPGGAQIIPLEEGWENQIKKKVRRSFRFLTDSECRGRFVGLKKNTLK